MYIAGCATPAGYMCCGSAGVVVVVDATTPASPFDSPSPFPFDGIGLFAYV